MLVLNDLQNKSLSQRGTLVDIMAAPTMGRDSSAAFPSSVHQYRLRASLGLSAEDACRCCSLFRVASGTTSGVPPFGYSAVPSPPPRCSCCCLVARVVCHGDRDFRLAAPGPYAVCAPILLVLPRFLRPIGRCILGRRTTSREGLASVVGKVPFSPRMKVRKSEGIAPLGMKKKKKGGTS